MAWIVTDLSHIVFQKIHTFTPDRQRFECRFSFNLLHEYCD